MTVGSDTTTEMELLVTVKAYPSISQTYGEAVCVAGIRIDTEKPEWVRLFPVRFRELPPDQRFSKYQVIRLRARKHSTDRRVESWRPELDSIQPGQLLPAGAHWPARRRWVEPLIGPTMCALNRGRAGGAAGPSLSLVKPAKVCDLKVRLSEPWSHGQLATLGQASLLVEKTTLEKPDHTFSYHWFCEDSECSGHTQSIVDWEIGEAYRSWTRRGYNPIEAVRTKWLDELCGADRDTYLFVGDQHSRPGQFLVLGAFYPEPPPDENQLQLALVA